MGMRGVRTVLMVIAFIHVLPQVPPVGAQPTESVTSSPEEVAESYLRRVEAMEWDEMVRHVHPEALASFRSHLDVILLPGGGRQDDGAMPDATTLEALAGVSTVEEYRETPDERVLLLALRLLEEHAPGILNAWVDRTTHVLGMVPEADSLAHVVYRLQWGLSGSTPDTQVLTVARAPDGTWRILRSRELDSIRPAMNSVLIRVRATAPADGTS